MRFLIGMDEVLHLHHLLHPIVKKVLVCTTFLLAFFLLESLLSEKQAHAAPLLSSVQAKPGPGIPPAFSPQETSSMKIDSSFRLASSGGNFKLAPTQWELLGKQLLHSIGGDDSRSYFGFSPHITVVTNPLPFAALTGGSTLLFSSGLLEVLRTRDEYAFLIAHELAHEMLGHLSSHRQNTPWSLNEELEADQFALKLLRDSDFKVENSIQILHRLELFGGEAGLPLNRLHPTLSKRREQLQTLLPRTAGKSHESSAFSMG